MDIPQFSVNLTTNAREALEMVDALILHRGEANRLIRELSGREVHLRFAPGPDEETTKEDEE